MNLDDIKKHWTDLAIQYQQDVNATTKTVSIKKLEIASLKRAIEKTSTKAAEVLEVGCGNGLNCFALAEHFPGFSFTGVDYVPEMIESARELKRNQSKFDKTSFFVGDILKLSDDANLKAEYDIVFTDRCVINLNTVELQKTGLTNLLKKVKKGGHLIILENITENHSRQNDCREAVGLSRREVPPYNLFMSENDLILPLITKEAKLKHVDDFGSLHDLLLYVIVPMINKGVVDYNHPVVHAATEFLLNSPKLTDNTFGKFGQNRLYLFHKQ